MHLLRPKLLLLLILCSTATAQHTSQFQGDVLARMLSEYRGCRIEIHTDKARYVQGQSIYMRYHIVSDKSREQPWMDNDILSYIKLFKDNEELLTRPNMLVEPRQFGPIGKLFEGVLVATGRIWSKGSDSLFGFKHILPGTYTGYFDCGITSDDFTFTVDPVPDSLRSTWDDYCIKMRSISDQYLLGERRDLASVNSFMKDFMAHPAGSLWRKEILETGLVINSMAFNAHNQPLQPNDSVFLDAAIGALIDEPEEPVFAKVNLAVGNYCKFGASQQKIAYLRAFAKRTRNPEIAKYVKSRLKFYQHELKSEEKRKHSSY